MLAEHFPQTDEFSTMAFRVNRILANRFHEVLDFINMHYCMTRRTDTEFWREVQARNLDPRVEPLSPYSRTLAE